MEQSCVLHATAATYGAIAASQRNSPNENSGFSFLQCKLDGSGKLYLGRAWGRYAQVVYSLCDMGDIVVPQGWHDWDDRSRRRCAQLEHHDHEKSSLTFNIFGIFRTVWFAEYNCRGGGAVMQEELRLRNLNPTAVKTKLQLNLN
ncbi:Pectinesterase [Nymphaea thermarum]|nr:Pectinesterase [Nymphaea thermarum]